LLHGTTVGKEVALRTRFRMTAALAAGLLLAGCAGTDEDPTADTAAEADDSSDDDAMGDHAMDEDAVGDDVMDEEAMGGEAMGEPAEAAEATRTIEVEAFDMAFDLETISVEANEVVTFEVTNTGAAVHEFFLGDSAMQQEHAEEMAEMGSDMAHDEPYSITLEPGDTKELTWRFGEAGSIEYACHEPGHYEAGMHGQMSIN
jgi:uncharacterized cupredoxin-like copper-binding protein